MNLKNSLFTLLLIVGLTTYSQDFKLDVSDSFLKIKGTSTLHDWEMISSGIVGDYIVTNDELKYIDVVVPVESFKSGKKIMDKKCYDALKYKTNPHILYYLKTSNKNKDSLIFNGSMTVAGVEKTLDIKVKRKIKDGTINLSGTAYVKLSDFNVDPPKALMGTITTGNDIEIEFNLNFKENK